jgi:alpha-beta hydrolase superfamily lysophospholipase
MSRRFEVVPDWVHVTHVESSEFREVYGFAGGGHGSVNLEGIRLRPKDRPSRTLIVYMHPASTLQLLPLPRAMVERGAHVLCAGSRYARNDTPLIMEKVLIDLGAYLRHARDVWGYERIVLAGWSGGGSLSLFYQSQAERPTITRTPAGDPVDIPGARLIAADAMLLQAAHISRAVMLRDWIDPSVRDEDNPEDRDPELDLYDPRNPNQPPYSAGFIQRFQAAQLARVRRRTAWVKETLQRLKTKGGNEKERGFVTHRTMADPRFLDAALEPNDRPIGQCYLGHPETVNSGPVGLARFSTLRAWLSQWSIDDTNAEGERCAAGVTVPLLAIENTADDAVPQSHMGRLFTAAGSVDKKFMAIKGATHYYVGQPALLQEAVTASLHWLGEHGFGEYE